MYGNMNMSDKYAHNRSRRDMSGNTKKRSKCLNNRGYVNIVINTRQVVNTCIKRRRKFWLKYKGMQYICTLQHWCQERKQSLKMNSYFY